MRDGYDWSVLQRSSDPAPGDPGLVQAGGLQYVEVADAIARSVDRLRSLDAGGDHVSEAVDALMDTAREVAESIRQAEGRYRETGEALLEYAPVLAGAQDTTLDAWVMASEARADAEQAESSRTYYLSLAGDDPEQALHYENLADSAGDAAAAAAGRLAQALEMTSEAVATRDAAAERAVGRIRDFIESDGLRDSWWDNWGSDLLAAITDIAGWVATVAGVLALVVAWIPVVGPVLASGLLVVAGIAAVVNALGNTVLAATGERTWFEAGMSILGAALSVVGLGAAARVVGNAAAAARINARAAVQAGARGERLTTAQAIRLRPSTLSRSERLWRTDVPTPARGDRVHRLYGDQSGPTGASWSPTDPRTLAGQHREALGLPDVNSAERLVVARLDDPGQVVLQRHALPLDGMPGGGPEYIIPAGNQTTGITVLEDVVFRVP